MWTPYEIAMQGRVSGTQGEAWIVVNEIYSGYWEDISGRQ